ncbi:hypothetical protein JCM9743_34970 [Natrinema sp. JCM 9743]
MSEANETSVSFAHRQAAEASGAGRWETPSIRIRRSVTQPMPSGLREGEAILITGKALLPRELVSRKSLNIESLVATHGS